MLRCDGFMPNVPQKALGMVMDPAVSVPVANGAMPAATAAAEPPLDPPAVRARSDGVGQSGPSRFVVSPSSVNSGVLVLPTMMAPAALRRST